MPNQTRTTLISATLLLLCATAALAFTFPGSGLLKSKPPLLTPENGQLALPLDQISDGKAHHFRVLSDDGTMVTFFVLKSKDKVIRAAMDACDVCYRAGLGYTQDGDFMVCGNCGQRFASNKINVIKGGCNPAPLERVIQGQNLVIAMADINKNSWYSKYQKQ